MSIKVIHRTDYLTWSFVFAALISMLAKFSIYKFPALGLLSMIIVLLISILNKDNHIIWKKRKKEAKLFATGWCSVYAVSTFFNLCLPQLGLFEALFYGVLFLCLNNSMQKAIFEKFAWCLAVLLLLSSIEFLIYRTIGKGIVLGYTIRSTSLRDTHFVNLLFNLVRIDNLIPRFQCLADEPGLIGTLCGLMLFYSTKVKNMIIPSLIFLFSGILSFSLAFYVILSIYLLANIRLNTKNMLFIVSISFILLLFKEGFNDLIVSRVVDNEDIDNRTSETFDKYLSKSFVSGELWLGRGANNLPHEVIVVQGMAGEGGNSGAKKWILEYGIIGFLILFFLYNHLYLYRSNYQMRYYDWLFLLVFWLSFYQRQTIYSPYTLITFLSMPLLQKYHLSKKNKKWKKSILLLRG